MILRRLSQDDIEQIINLQRENFSDGWNENMLVSAFNENNFFALGYFENDLLVSFVSYSITPDTADVEGVCTSLQYRNKGLARGVLKEVEKTLIEKGIRKLFLEVRESNINAISLYKSLGFNQISVRKKYYSNGENALIFIKGL